MKKVYLNFLGTAPIRFIQLFLRQTGTRMLLIYYAFSNIIKNITWKTKIIT